MADLLIRRCTIKIVRHGGWAWGAAPRALLDRALKSLPELIGAEVERLWPEDEEREISAPVRLRIAASLAELRAKPANCDDDLTYSAPDSALAARLGAELRRALAQELDGLDEHKAAASEIIESNPFAETRPTANLAPTNPLGVLAAWHQEGRLHMRLRSFALDALMAWHTHILSLPAAAPLDQAAAADLAARLKERLATRPAGIADDPAAVLRLRLEVFAVLQSMMEGALGSPVIRETIDRALSYRAPSHTHARDPQAPASIKAPGARPSSHPRLKPAATPPAPSPAGSQPHKICNVPQERQISCALPFLMLGPLSRLGYFAALEAVLAAAGLPEAMPLFALALAYKALDPPARGWLRSPSVREAAAAFSLLAEAPEDGKIASLAAAIAPQLSPLDAVVEDVLCEGHHPGAAFLLTRTGSGPESLHVLWDIDGLFPVAMAADMAPVLRRMPQELVLVPAGVAEPECLAMLDAAGARFVTDAQPCRGESFRSIKGRPGERWWSNDMLSSEEWLAAAGSRLDEVFELAEESWVALAVERPAIPRRSGDFFERSLTLAASLALGTIAWELWRNLESTAPALTLSRFHDLQARVRVDSDRVSILLPRGRRFTDLREHGLLQDVATIPWFAGRLLSFGLG